MKQSKYHERTSLNVLKLCRMKNVEFILIITYSFGQPNICRQMKGRWQTLFSNKNTLAAEQLCKDHLNDLQSFLHLFT